MKPHRVSTFKLSNDKAFAEKLKAIMGLYLSPPKNAMVFCCDEKSQIQALDRWRNIITTRVASHTAGEVKLEEHIKWQKVTLKNKNRKLYVAEEQGTFVGTVRADFERGFY